jgi:hypothetical protein
MKRLALTLCIAATMSACADIGQDSVAVPLRVAGTAVPAEGIRTIDGVTVRLSRADLAFGPLVLCAGATAGDLCNTARMEWLDTVVVDALDPQPVAVGTLDGVSGSVRSWMYDLGISSQLTHEAPFVLSAAQALDGMSVILEGEVSLDGISLPLRAALPIAQTGDAERGVPVVRKSSSDVFAHDVTGAEVSLTVRFDSAAWLRGLKLRPAVEAVLACANSDSTDCVDALTFETNSVPFRALRAALLAGARPEFDWDSPQ